MNSLVIGVDIDGVLTDFEGFVLEKGFRYFKKKYKIFPVNEDGFDVDEVFGVTRKQLLTFWLWHYFDYCVNLKARNNTSKTINELRNEGHKIIIITGRMFSYSRTVLGIFMRLTVKAWLKRNNITYDKILFCPEHDSKDMLCKENRIDVMMDDKQKNTLELSKNIPVICMKARYNKQCHGKNIYRISDMTEVMDIIRGLNK